MKHTGVEAIKLNLNLNLATKRKRKNLQTHSEVGRVTNLMSQIPSIQIKIINRRVRDLKKNKTKSNTKLGLRK
jgi:hypothetical protein